MLGSVRYSDRNEPDRSIAVSRYDLVLVAIPLAFVLGLFAAEALALSFHSGVALGSTLGGVAVTDALFVNPPSRGGDD